MFGDVPNYFHAVGCFDCSWTQRVESAYSLAAEMIMHMSQRGLRVVRIPKRTDVEQTFVFRPTYFTRAPQPVVYGLSFVPTIDYFWSFRLKGCSELWFA